MPEELWSLSERLLREEDRDGERAVDGSYVILSICTIGEEELLDAQ